MNSLLKTAGAVLGAAVLTKMVVNRAREARYPISGKVVLITGGSRGLGLLLARELSAHGAKLVLLARDPSTLETACSELRSRGEVLGIPCDVTDPHQVNAAVARAQQVFGRIDLVINDAGRIEVGPARAMTTADYEAAMATNFWGAYHVIHAVLPQMRAQGEGRIVNISSIGGLLSVPHLLPYSASKFALTGYSLGLRAELARENIVVTTVCPGLMRTGSPINANFKGNQAAEYAWFTAADSLPGLSMSGERAARQIVRAARRGQALSVLSLPAQLGAFLQGTAPNLMAELMTLTARGLPDADSPATRPGRMLRSPRLRWLTVLTETAARRNNQWGQL
ncbi:MAG TPA: SDR family NAD(P)-dependent oxidoreductase [Polyangiaceae bacterium]|nr:SDR family NAD(P)-dependent oxidoreductase [Polyangiaceae bacterium]